MVRIISYPWKESRSIITDAFKRPNVIYANSKGSNFGTCQNNNDPSTDNLLYHESLQSSLMQGRKFGAIQEFMGFGFGYLQL